MAEPQRASWLALPPEPWKNGGGVTRTLAADPDGRWRVSIADIERDGPYSRFPGYDRVSVVLSGDGVTLQGEGVAVPLRPREPAPFGGDVGLQSTLIGGPVRVLNLFVRRGEAAASVTCAGVAAGRCDVGGLPGAMAGRAVTQLIVAADAGGAGGQGGFRGSWSQANTCCGGAGKCRASLGRASIRRASLGRASLRRAPTRCLPPSAPDSP